MKKYLVSVMLMLSIIIPFTSFAQTSGDIDPDPNRLGCINIVNNLRYRSRDMNTNGEVSTLQDFLQARNLFLSEPTGYFGLLTVKAVKDFQTGSSISPTGYVGPLTRAKIKNISCGIELRDVDTTMPCTTLPSGSTVSAYNSPLTKCGTPIPPTPKPNSDCPKGALFSSESGRPCIGTVTKLNITIPEAQQGYDSSTQDGGLYYKVNRGQTYKVFFTAVNGGGVTQNYYVYAGSQYIGNTEASGKNYINWTIPGNLSMNAPSFVQFLTTPDGLINSAANNLAGTSPRIWPNTSTNFPPGCTSTSGWSTTTGQACGDDSNTILSAYLNANEKAVATIEKGQAVTLSWKATGASYCYGSPWYTGNMTDSTVLYPTQTTSYTMVCIGANQKSVTSTATVKINLQSSVYLSEAAEQGYDPGGAYYRVKRGQTYQVGYEVNTDKVFDNLYLYGDRLISNLPGQGSGQVAWTVPTDMSINAPTYLQIRSTSNTYFDANQVIAQSARVFVQ